MDSRKKSRDFAATKNIGPEVLSTDFVASDVLDSRPPLGVEKNLVGHPVGNGLLADGGSIKEVGDGFSERDLAAGNSDGPLKSGNVRSIHDHRGYTNRFVKVNNPVCVTDDKKACMVFGMALIKKKQEVKVGKQRKAIPGNDGKTLGQRLSEAMAYESGRRRAEYKQTDLLKDVNRLAGSPDDKPAMTQQMLSAITVGKVSRSSLTPLMATACHVNPLWLGDGVGKMIHD
jgi:hypothetical protein